MNQKLIKEARRILRNRWRGMMDRCYNEKDDSYKAYGGKGVRVCDEWHDPLNFIAWGLKNGFDPRLSWKEQTLERKDVTGDYGPENCELVSLWEQAQNKRNSVKHEYKGQMLTAGQLAKNTKCLVKYSQIG